MPQAPTPALDVMERALAVARQVRGELAPCVARLQEQAASSGEATGSDAALLAQVVGALYALEARREDAEAFLEGLREALQNLRHLLTTLQERGIVESTVTERVAAALARLFPLVTSLQEARQLEDGDTSGPPSDAPVLLTRPRRRPPPPPSEPPGEEPVVLLERRAVRRVDLEVGIGFHSESNFYTGFSGDISEGGLFVATYDLLPVGTEVNLSFWLPDGQEVTTRGRVAWVRRAQGEQPPGMGIRFVALSDEARDAIGRFVARREPIFHDD